jgi:hypothetical protein
MRRGLFREIKVGTIANLFIEGAIGTDSRLVFTDTLFSSIGRKTGCSDRWRLNTAFADCRKATFTAKERGTTSAAFVQKHLPWKDAAILLRSQCMLALRPDA